MYVCGKIIELIGGLGEFCKYSSLFVLELCHPMEL